MKMNTDKLKKTIILNLPLIICFWLGDKLSYSYRIADGSNFSEKLLQLFTGISDTLLIPPLSLNLLDLTFGLAVAALFKVFLIMKKKNAKNYRPGEEYGGAKWGNAKDIEPYIDHRDFFNNVLLTQTERLTMGKPSSPKYDRNKNILVIGGSGSGKTRFVIKPNLMQMHSSYVVTDPKGTVLPEVGSMLQRGRPTGKKDKNGREICEPYRILVFNTVNFDKSLHYNPFAYITEENREQDILKFVEVLIKNTSAKDEKADFWVKAEKLLYSSYIALMFATQQEKDVNFELLLNLINISECHEEDESFKNAIDWTFYYLEKWVENDWNKNDFVFDKQDTDAEVKKEFSDLPDNPPDEKQISIGRFAVRQYKAYKLAAGVT